MLIRDKKFGEIECVIDIGYSAVDSFIESAYSVNLNRFLTDEEMDELQKQYADKIQMWSYENGSRDHN